MNRTKDDRRPDLPAEASLTLATFGLLALELAVIRWMSGQVRIFAYLNNVVLICAFLGMGLGVALSETRPRLRRLVLPAFVVFCGAVAVLRPLGLDQVTFPDLSIYLWGAEVRAAWGSAFLSLLMISTLLAGVVGCFLLSGVAVGYHFRRLPTLRAYSFDLLGSLLGVVAIALVTAWSAPPAAWFLVGGTAYLLLNRRWIGWASLAGILVVTGMSGGDALYSPYNRIELGRLPDGDFEVRVNRDFHQYMYDLSRDRIAAAPVGPGRQRRIGTRAVYDLPYRLPAEAERALIIGAGTGNDAQAALRAGFDTVYAVDIDPVILRVGGALHPEEPYQDGRVIRVVQDARAFLEQYDGAPFDIVSFGFLDSHAMFSAMSSLRLENYVYTEEGLRAAWEHLDQGGILSLAFSTAAGPWISDRIYWTLAEATGSRPRLVDHDLHGGSTFLLARGRELGPEAASPFPSGEPTRSLDEVRTTSDNWPFLYLRPGAFPWAYAAVLVVILFGATVAVRRVFGREVVGGGFDAPLFFMGAAFLLLETRGITNLSLLFGTTWVVNAAVFSGILLTVLLANLAVIQFRPERERPWFVPLALSLGLLWLLPASELTGLSMLMRGVVGGLLVGIPVGFAGIIVSIRLSRARDPTAALGSNLLGAVLGGCLEYLSMAIGLQGLLLLAAGLYLAALALLGQPVAAVSTSTDRLAEAGGRE